MNLKLHASQKWYHYRILRDGKDTGFVMRIFGFGDDVLGLDNGCSAVEVFDEE